MDERKTCWVIAGPTASGKTALSIRLAHSHNCEIISMDSMQIYRGMDIGTAKSPIEEREGVPHHLLDVCDPRDSFSVADWQAMAEEAAEDIFSRGKQPLFVGGTGFYLRALRHPMAMGVVAGDPVIRGRLEAEAIEENGPQRLHDRLKTVDPETAARLPVGDVRRVIRALEVSELTGVPFSKQPQLEQEPRFRYRVVSLDMDRALLYARIEKRVDQMMEAGLMEELKRLLAEGVPETAQSLKAIGYKELLPVLHGEWDLDKAIYEIKKGTRHYAKRQLTWMRREEDVLWVDVLSEDLYEKTERWFLGGDSVETGEEA